MLITSIKDKLIDNINNQTQLLNYITGLEHELNSCKNKLSEKCKPYIPINKLQYCTLYYPEVVFAQPKKCGKCNENGLILIDDSFAIRYNVCKCREYKPQYKVQQFNVQITSFDTSTSKTNYDGYVDRKYISISSDCVFNTFCEEHLTLSCSNVFYTNQEACELYCRRKNK